MIPSLSSVVKQSLILFSILSFCISVIGEELEKADSLPGEIIIVTATSTERDEFDTPKAVTVIEDKAIQRENHLSIVDILDDSIGIWVENRTSTTGDPVIRGLSGSNLLALIDGNTL